MKQPAMMLVALLAVLILPAIALAENKLTLEEAVTTALEKNPARKATIYEKRAASADIGLAKSALLPQLGFSEGFQRGNDPVFVFGSRLRQQRFSSADFALNRLNTPTSFSNFATRFSGQWRLFDSGVSWLRLRQSKRMDEIAARKLERVDQELVMRVIDAYTGLLLAAKQQQVAEDALKTSQSILDRSRANVQAGMAVESDLLSSQVSYASREQELIRARHAVALAQAQLRHEMGIAPDTQFEVEELLAEKVFPSVPLAELDQMALQNRPDLRGLVAQQAAQSDSVRAAKAAYGPRLNAIADWEADNPRLGGAGGNNWLAGVEIQLDLFDGGAKRARLQREHAVKDRVDALHDAAVSSIRLEVRKAYLDLDAARQQLQVARAAVEQAQESLRIGQNRYEAGLSTITDLLRMQDASVRAQTDYAQAIYRLRTSYANLELATGTLGVSSLVVKQ